MQLFPRLFKRMRRTRLLPTPPKKTYSWSRPWKPYKCGFEGMANGLYRYIRLRTIWYETVFQKKAPSDYRDAITKLERLDKIYQRYIKIYHRIAIKDDATEEALRILNRKSR